MENQYQKTNDESKTKGSSTNKRSQMLQKNFVIHHNDVLDELRRTPDESFKLVISSPPYNIGKEYEKRMSLDNYLCWQKDIIRELCRVTAWNGSIAWQIGNYVRNAEIFPLDFLFYPLFKENGMILRNRIIWHYNHGLHARKRFSGRYEVLLWFTKSDEYTFNLDPVRIPQSYPAKRAYKGPNKGELSCNPLGKNPSDFWAFLADEWNDGIWDFPNVKNNHKEKTIHPCQFPVELVERCILALTDPGDRILDPFGGTGTSIIAALKHQRKAVMIEAEQAYVNIAENRIAQFFNGNLATRPIGIPLLSPEAYTEVHGR